jgi:hypothetical protein
LRATSFESSWNEEIQCHLFPPKRRLYIGQRDRRAYLWRACLSSSDHRCYDWLVHWSRELVTRVLLLGRALPKLTPNLLGVDFYALRDISTMQVSRIFQIFNNGILYQEMELSIFLDND